MTEVKMGLAELKNMAIGFGRAEMRDVHVVKDSEDYLSKRHMGKPGCRTRHMKY